MNDPLEEDERLALTMLAILVTMMFCAWALSLC